MAKPSNPGGGGGYGGGHGGEASVVTGSGGGGASIGGESAMDDLDELWPSRPSPAAAMLGRLWGQNPVSSERFALSLGLGLDE
jgi:hypothetical protein